MALHDRRAVCAVATVLPDGLGGLLRFFVRESADESRPTIITRVLMPIPEEYPSEPRT